MDGAIIPAMRMRDTGPANRGQARVAPYACRRGLVRIRNHHSYRAVSGQAHMTVHHIEVPGVTLRVDDMGYGAPVVMLPGMLCDATLFEQQAQALAPHCRVIRPDWRGHGYSTVPDSPWRMERLVEDVRAVCNVLQLDRVTLVGFSLGGMVAMRFALAHAQRVRALVLLNTSGQREDGWRRFKFHALANLAGSIGPVPFLTGEAAKAMFSPRFRHAHPQVVTAWRQRLGNMSPRVVREVVRMVADRDDVLAGLRTLRIPALVIAGGQDVNTPPAHAESLSASLARSLLKVMPASGHATPLEQPEAVLSELSVFLAACGVLPPEAALAQASPAQAAACAGRAERAASPAPTRAADSTPKASAKAEPWKTEAGWP